MPIRLLAFLASLAALGATELPLPVENPSTMALARPTPSQLELQEMGFGLFVHWSPCVYQGTDNDTGKTPVNAINPDRFDANQIVRAAHSCGARYVLWVAKHVGGYCTWPTKTTDYSIRNSPWRNGKGDMVGELAAACANAGLKFGVYLCPRDDHAEIANTGKAGARQNEANAYYRAQLTELLTNYRPMFEVWFDGGLVVPVNDLFEKHAPDALTFQGRRPSSTRWGGNEYGTTDYPCWSTISGREADFPSKGPGIPDGNRWAPAECNVSILCPKWFWSPGCDQRVLHPDRLMHIYYQSVGRSSILLLSIAPDDHGAVPEVQMKRLAAMGEEIRSRFAKPLKSTSAVMTATTGELLLPFAGEITIDHVRLREDIRGGERIRQFTLEAKIGDNTWTALDTGSHIGVRQIIPFPAVKATALRLKITRSAGPPAISEFAAFYAAKPIPKTAFRPTALKLSATAAPPPTPKPAPAVAPRAMTREERAEELYQKLFSLMDLTRPELATLREKVEAGKFTAAMLDYRAILVSRVAKQPRNGRFGYNLWQPANADELLEGKATTVQYGDTSIRHTVHIGKPGEINFFASLPEYRPIGRDISNFAWVNKYAEAYGKTNDPKYLAGWCLTMADFADRWPEQWKAIQLNNPDRIPSLGWNKGPLMIGMRLYALHAGFVSVLQTADDAGQVEKLDPYALAGVIVQVATAQMNSAIPWLKKAGGNQVRQLAAPILEWGILLPEMNDARRWRDEAVPANVSTVLLDGSDREQSLNYFNNSVGPLLNLVRKRIPQEEQTPALMAKLEMMNAYRGRVIPSLVRPDGFIPGTGTDPVWNNYGKSAKLTPPSTAFTSINFPYGGYAVQRDGWNPDSLYLFMKQTRPSWGHWRAIDGALQLSAYGRNLLVSPMGQVYDKRDSDGGWTTYWGNAVSQNAIVVDGMSSNEKSGDFDKLSPWRWHTSARFDFMETDVTGPYKGADFRVDGLNWDQRKQRKEWKEPTPVTDVTHRRQVHFLREIGCWIVTDHIQSKQSHDFTQSWCLGPEFSEKEVEVNAVSKTIITRQATGPNLSLFQFGSPELRYERYYGVRDEKRILGWVGIIADKEKWLYTPAVAVHTNWKGAGDALLVTLMVPRPAAAERIAKVTNISSNGIFGFDATLPDGRAFAYRAAANVTWLRAFGLTAQAKSLLVARDSNNHLSGIVLDAKHFDNQASLLPDSEFAIPILDPTARCTAIDIPAGFAWIGNGASLVPTYQFSK